MLLILVNSLPLLLAVVSCFFYWRCKPPLPKWRLSLLLLGITLSAVSSGALAAFWVHAMTGQPKGGDFAGNYLLAMWGLGVLGLPLSFFGSGPIRWLLFANSALVTVLWYLGLMAASV
jgi:hypothetical protein